MGCLDLFFLTGRDVVERVMEDRREQLRRRCGAKSFPKPQLPVIPLPLDEASFGFADGSGGGTSRMGLPPGDAVVLWLGRRSMLTTDPWPAIRFSSV